MQKFNQFHVVSWFFLLCGFRRGGPDFRRPEHKLALQQFERFLDACEIAYWTRLAAIRDAAGAL